MAGVRSDVYRALAFLDIIDHGIQSGVKNLDTRITQILDALEGIESIPAEVSSLSEKMDRIIELVGGVTIPDWQTAQEVMEGWAATPRSSNPNDERVPIQEISTEVGRHSRSSARSQIKTLSNPPP